MAQQVKDVVCGRTLDKDEARMTCEYQGETYYFCCPGCKAKFEEEPEKYAQTADG